MHLHRLGYTFAAHIYDMYQNLINRFANYTLTIVILDTGEQVLWNIMETQMKYHIIGRFSSVYTILLIISKTCKGNLFILKHNLCSVFETE